VRKRWFVVGAVLACWGLSACGEKSDTLTASATSAQNVTLMLDWQPNPDHVGLYQAIAAGSFSQAGLNVHIQVPSDPATPLKQLAAGKVDFAISYEPELLLARNQNEPLVSVAALVQKPLTSIVSLGSKHITRVSQLRGKRVGDAGLAYQHDYLTTILGGARIQPNSVKEVNVGQDLVPAMLSGRVDATIGAYWNVEALQLQQMGKHPNVVHMEQVGIPTYDELVLVVRTATLTQRPDVVRRFVQALARGYESARRDPAAAVHNLVHLNPGVNPKLALASVRATLPAFFSADPAQPWGYQNPLQWNLYGQWMLDHHLLTNPNAPVDASTNEVLAGQGI
jgi:putative hydroxymethylpyrimidine transport system substrate-binding protein